MVQKSIHTQWYKKAFTHSGTKKVYTHNGTKKHTRKAFCVYFSTYANLIRPNGIRTDFSSPPPPGINLGTVQNEGFSRMFQVYTRAGFEGSLLPVFRNGRCNSGQWISATEPHRRDATSEVCQVCVRLHTSSCVCASFCPPVHFDYLSTSLSVPQPARLPACTSVCQSVFLLALLSASLWACLL